MGDELDAFFAKKSKGKKKKGVIKLQEVAEQLEKSAKIQDELEEAEEKDVSEASKTRSAGVVNNDEDSEWLDFDTPVIMPSVVIKELDDVDIESEEEEEHANTVPLRTWNVGNNKNTEENVPTIKAESKYVPKAQRNPLDISDEFAFPSLDNAAEVEKKQMEEMVEVRRIELEEKHRKEAEQKRAEEAYRAPRPAKRPTGEKPPPSVSEEADDWRSQAKTIAAEEPAKEVKDKEEQSREKGGYRAPRPPRAPINEKPQPVSDEAENWRAQAKTIIGEEAVKEVIDNEEPPRERAGFNKAPGPFRGHTNKISEEADNWRAKPKTTVVEEEAVKEVKDKEAPTAKVQPAGGGTKAAYVPPHLRNKKQ